MQKDEVRRKSKYVMTGTAYLVGISLFSSVDIEVCTTMEEILVERNQNESFLVKHLKLFFCRRRHVRPESWMIILSGDI